MWFEVIRPQLFIQFCALSQSSEIQSHSEDSDVDPGLTMIADRSMALGSGGVLDSLSATRQILVTRKSTEAGARVVTSK